MNDNHIKRIVKRPDTETLLKAELLAGDKLQERIKELHCLQRISEAIESSQDLGRIFQISIDALSNAMNYYDITCARILFQGQSYHSERFHKTDWCLSADLRIMDKVVGAVEVYYLEERPAKDEGSFLMEERNLVNLCAAKLERAIERQEISNSGAISDSEEDLKEYHRSIIEKASTYAFTLTAIPLKDRVKLNEVFEEARNWFENIPTEYLNERVIVRKYACYSYYYRWNELYDEVFRCVIDINNFHPRDEDSIYFGWIYLNASRVANLLGLVSASIEYGYKAIDFIEKSQIKSEMCKCYNVVGACFIPIEYHEVSFGLFKKAYRLAVETGIYISKLSSLNNMGYNRILVGEYDTAKKILLRAKELLGDEIVRPDMSIQINLNLATVALHDNNFAEAHEFIEIAQRYNVSKSIYDTISILQIEGDILVKENRLPEAMESLTSALKFATDKHLDRYSAKIEKSLADVLILEKRYEEAIEHQRNCMLLQEKLTTERAQSQFRYIHYEREARESRVTLEKKLIELKQTEETLRQEKVKFELITEASPTALIVTRLSDGVIRYVNEQCARLIGADVSYLINKPTLDFYVNPVDRYTFISFLKESGTVQNWEITLKQLDGTPFPALVSARVGDFLGEDSIYAGIEDITERKQAEAERTKLLEQLQKSLEKVIELVVHTVELRDPYTAGHQLRVAKLASAIAEEMRYPEEKVRQIYMAGSIHDLGKIAIPAEILSKPTKLNSIEFMLIQTHPQVSKEILSGIDFSWPLAEVLYQHHERLDGSGYPQGLIGSEILPEAKIMAVADVVEAMASHRPYRPALGLDVALNEIVKGRGVLFEPAVVDACIRLFQEKGFDWDK